MAPKFANIKFNLMRAIEFFEDMNHEDMDVTAPPSNNTFCKERELADKLNSCLLQLVESGFFDDCNLREDGSEMIENEDEDEGQDDEDLSREEDEEDSLDEEDEHNHEATDDSLPSSPRSEGFGYEATSSTGSSRQDHDDGEIRTENRRRNSRESFTDRVKRYVKRIMPSSGGHRSRHEAGREGHHRDGSRSVSQNSMVLSHNRDSRDEDHRPARGISKDGKESPRARSPLDNRHQHKHDIHDHHHRQRDRHLSSLSSNGTGSPLSERSTEPSHDEDDSSYINDEPIGSSRSSPANSGASRRGSSGIRRRSLSRSSRRSGSSRFSRARSTSGRRASRRSPARVSSRR